MKFMKLGSRPDTFYTAEDDVRSLCSEVTSDLIVQVKGTKFLLHKFPLLSKCLKLQKLCSESSESSSSHHQLIQLSDIPGGIESFELCAKFCYGMTIHISSYNVVSARCAAEYLQMTEEVEKGNLIYKLQVFFNSCILNGWKDSIVALQSTKSLVQLSEDLKITSKCIESIASKVLNHPSKTNFSHNFSKKLGSSTNKDDNISSCNGSATKGYWWAEDIAELGVDLYWRTMIVIKSGKIPSVLIGDALQIYASRWLLGIAQDDDNNQEINSKRRLLLESIVSLLPNERGSVSCRFLCRLLKAANILNASSSPRIELARRIGVQLDEAKTSDLLIPSQTSYKNDTIYDVDIVMAIIEQFMLQGQSPPTSPFRVKGGGGGFERRRSRSAEIIDFMFQEGRRSSSASHSSKLKVAKLVDGYLQEIASDINLPLSKMVSICEVVPGFARPDHDDLYRAIDVYLKGFTVNSQQFMLQGQSPPTSPFRVKGGGGGFERRRSRSAEIIDFMFQEGRRSSSASHSSKLKVAKLVDGYLQEIASDINLPLSKMVSICEVVPGFARPDHDDLYRAIDVYLKAHPDLNKSERKRLCRALDCKKLSMKACIHAAQNELLPLRVVVQVLFFEQARAAIAGGQVTDLPKNIKALLSAHKLDPSRSSAPPSTVTSIQVEDQWSVSGFKSPKSQLSTLRMKLDEDDNDIDDHALHDRNGLGRSSRFKSFCVIPTRPKRMLSKLWSINRNGS